MGKATWMRVKTKVVETEVEGAESARVPILEETGGHAPPPGSKPQPPTTSHRNHIEGVVFVPCTPGGELAKLLQVAEDQFAKLHGIPRI